MKNHEIIFLTFFPNTKHTIKLNQKYTLVHWNIMWVNCKSIAECVEEGSTKPKGKFSQCTLVLTTLNISRLLHTVNQKVCSSHQIKPESLVTIITPKYGMMRTPHRLGVKYTPNLV